MDIATVPHIEFNVNPTDAEDVVIEQISYLKDKADTALQSLESALDDLRSQITSASMPSLGVSYDYINDTIESGLDSQKPDRPNFPSVSGVDPIERRELVDIQVPVFPTIPTFDENSPDDTFEYSEDEYQSTLMAAIQASLMDWVVNGGTGLTATVEQAIYDRARNRLQEEWELAYDEAMTFHSSRGWNIPSGPRNSVLRRVNLDFERKVEDLNQKIIETQANLAQNNTQFAHTMSVEVEKALMDNFNAVKNRLFQAAKDTVMLLYDVFAKKVEAYKARVQGIATGIDAESKKIDAQVSINNGITTMVKSDTDRFTAEIGAIISVIDGMAKVYSSDIDGYRADIDLEKSVLSSKVEKLRAMVAQSTNETELQLKEAEISLQSYISSLGLNIEVSKALASILAQIAASSLSAINTSAGINDTSSRGYTGHYSHSETLGNSKAYHESKSGAL